MSCCFHVTFLQSFLDIIDIYTVYYSASKGGGSLTVNALYNHGIFASDSLEIEKIGPKFENHPLFPRRINTEFAQIVDDKTIKMRVWERGAGETLACGTGACATMVAANLSGLVGDEADLVLLGGTLHIKWDKTDNCVYMTGPAAFVFDGEITI